MIHGAIHFFFISELIGFFEDLFKLHNKNATASKSVLAYHLLEHFINDHKCSFGPEGGRELKGLFSHKTSNRRFTNLLCNNNDVPIVELVGNVLDGIFL